MIGENIKSFTKNEGITLYRLAKKAGISNSYLSDLINGKQNNPSIDILKKISEALNVSIDELIKEKE